VPVAKKCDNHTNVSLTKGFCIFKRQERQNDQNGKIGTIASTIGAIDAIPGAIGGIAGLKINFSAWLPLRPVSLNS